ncbi:MAG TPA: antibiotic biosynthesis monooxygenase [Streptosporangiaceae bacterium]|nr:antibiotic biosynthesis monooxygenase [Streptosporangiaceae bacterium]
MSVPVLVAFVGALAAAVGTGMLTGRFIRAPRIDVAAWSSVLLLLAVALGAQTMGFALGFSAATFRAVQVTGLLLAPLWTAWGMVELAGRTVPARFAARLAAAALTVVPGVILILDPLTSAPAFGKIWPGEGHYMLLPKSALTGIHVIAIALALLMTSLAAARTRRDPAWWDVFVPISAAGAAVLFTVSLGFSLPHVGYPLLTAAAAGLIWFAASRSERIRLDQVGGEGHPGATAPHIGHRRHSRAIVDRMDRVDSMDSMDSMDPMGTMGARDPMDRMDPMDPMGTRDPMDPMGTRDSMDPLGTSGPMGTKGAAGQVRAIGDPTTGPLAALGTDGFPAAREFDPVAGSSVTPGPAAERAASIGRAAPMGSAASALPVHAAAPFGQPTGTLPPPFGLIAIYTLLDGRGEEFDRLTERTVEAVRAQEPGTLLFVVHTVPNAPMQRIFYEVYRDRIAYRDHRHMPHIEDFFAMHRPCVVATNVIELDLRYAKVPAPPPPDAMFSR